MTTMRAFCRLTEAAILMALGTACFMQHLRLRDLNLALSQTVGTSRGADARLAETKVGTRRIDQSLVTPSIAKSESGGFKNDALGATYLEVWFQNVRSLAAFAATHPELMIPQTALLQDQDWLDIARGKLESEDDLRGAMAKVRDLGRRRAAPEIGNALKAAIKAGDGRIPDSPRDLIPYLPSGFSVAILERMFIDPLGPLDERVPTRRFVLMERPVDASDQPLMFNTFGSPVPRPPSNRANQIHAPCKKIGARR